MSKLIKNYKIICQKIDELKQDIIDNDIPKWDFFVNNNSKNFITTIYKISSFYR